MANPLSYIDMIFAKNWKRTREARDLQARWIYNHDRGIEFAHNEKWEKVTMEGIELPNQESTRILGEKKNYKYFGILEPDTFKQTDEKKNKKK